MFDQSTVYCNCIEESMKFCGKTYLHHYSLPLILNPLTPSTEFALQACVFITINYYINKLCRKQNLFRNVVFSSGTYR